MARPVFSKMRITPELRLWLVALLSSIAVNCATTHDIYPPDKLPSYVRIVKSIRLDAASQKMDTAIHLNYGEVVTIMASKDQVSNAGVGTIVRWVGNDYEPLFWISSWVRSGTTFLSPQSGTLYLGVTRSAGPHASVFDSYDLILIVWKTNDYGKISEFLTEVQRKHPRHSGVADALSEAKYVQELLTAKAEANKEIEDTRKKIESLKQQMPQAKGGASLENDQALKQLEKRLADLTAKLSQLDELNLQLKEERAKAAGLTQEIEDGKQREKELMIKISAGAKIPPLLLITSPEDGSQNETGSVRLTGAAEDDRGLSQFEVLVNGRLLEGAEPRGIRPVEGAAPKRFVFERRVPLVQGANRIQVKATDSDGLTSETVLTVHYSASRRNVWAVVVGVNDYPQLSKLKFAVNDAKEFYRLLVEKNRVPPENITLLLNDQASLKNLRSTLGTKLKNAAGLVDMVIIFFAGHGATERDAMSTDGDGLEKYLLPWETDPADLYSTALPMREIAHIFGRIRSERLIFIADSCYSGASGGRTISVAGTRANITDSFLERITSGRGKVIITASAANEVSVEKDELQHGVFTYYLLEGLNGAADTDRDGTITVDEAYRYVSEKVPKATGQEQHPVKKGSVEGSLVLSITR